MAKIPIEIDVIEDKAIQSTDAFTGSLGGVIKGIQGMTRAALAFIATPIGAIIAAVGLALGALTSFFKRSEEGQNKLNKVVRIFSSILDNVLDVVDKVGEAIFEAISNPKETVIELGNLIKENLINRFKAFAVIGKAIAKIFSGEFREGFEDLANGAIQLTTGIEDFTDKAVLAFEAAVKGAKAFKKEVLEDIETAKKLADIEEQLNKDERKFTVDRARRDAQIAELRLKSREDAKFDAEQRKAFLDEASELINKQLDEELKIAQQRLFVARENNLLANSTIETKQEEADLEARLSELQTKRFTEQRSLQREFLRINNEIKKEQESQLKAEEELVLFRLEQDIEQLESIKERADAEVILEQEKTRFLLENEELFAAERILIEEKLADTIRAIRAGEIIDQATAAAKQKEIDDLLRSTKEENIDAILDATALGAKLLGEQTIAGIALGVAVATADTFIAANKTLAAFPGPLGIVLAAVTIAAGLANVAQIIKAGKAAGATAGGGGGGGAQVAQVATSAVNFPIVSTGISQQQNIVNVNSSISVEEIDRVKDIVIAKEVETTLG